MKIHRNLSQILAVSALALLTSAAAFGQENRDRAKSTVLANDTVPQIHLKLKDGSSIAVDEAWESEQGIWYRRGGMSHLVLRERVKTIERGSSSRSKPDPQVAKVVANDDKDDTVAVSNGSDDQPAWIYLVGGARVEADSVTESTAGAWYSRGKSRQAGRQNHWKLQRYRPRHHSP